MARAERYERFLYVDWVLAQIALLAVLWLYARRGAVFTRESAAGPIGTGMLLGMLGLAIVWLVRIPFRLAAHWWDRRYGITDLDRTPELETAVFRIFLAQQRRRCV